MKVEITRVPMIGFLSVVRGLAPAPVASGYFFSLGSVQRLAFRFDFSAQ
jgi:hypothetical protein